MDEKDKVHLSQNNYAFIDSQNLNLSIRSQGWVLDFRKMMPRIVFMNNLRGKLEYVGRHAEK